MEEKENNLIQLTIGYFLRIFPFIILFVLFNNCGVLFLKGKVAKKAIDNWVSGGLALFNSSKATSSPGSIRSIKLIDTIQEGKKVEFSFQLESAIGRDVNLTLKSSNNSLLVNGSTFSGITIPQDKLTSNQTLVLDAVEDINNENETVTIDISADGFSPLTFPVRVIDNDTQNILTSGIPTQLEEGKSSQFTIQVPFEPAQEYIVDIASSIPASLLISPAFVKFTKTNYSTPQTITLTAPEESNTTGELVSLNFSSSGAAISTNSVQVLDNDIMPVFSNGGVSVNLTEGTSTTLQVTLDGNPGANRTVYFTSSNSNSVIVSPASHIFTSLNWNLPINLTLTSKQDANSVSESLNILAGGTGLKQNQFAVTAVDDEVQNLVVTTPATITENTTANITVKLTIPPVTVVPVNLASSDPNLVLGAQVIFFTPANYATPQFVPITAMPDSNHDAETDTITISSAGITTITQSIIVLDDDTQIQISGVPASIKEGLSGSMQVKLSGNPGIPRTIALSSSLASLGFGSISLVFDSSNWSTNQSVTLNAVEDADHNSDFPTITGSCTGLVSGSANTIIYDNDTYIVYTGVTSVLEGQNRTIQAQLSGNPYSSVSVNFTSSDTSALTLTPASQTFNSTNWNSPFNITISGIPDPDSSNSTASISAAGTNLITSTQVYTVLDNNSIEFDPTNPTSVNENGTASIRIRLATPPQASTVFNIQSLDSTAISISPATLTFSDANYNSYQTITLTGVADVDNINDPVGIKVSSAGIQNTFNVTQTDMHPVISSFTPTSTTAPSVTITGTNFNMTPSANTVKFNGVTATVLSATSTTLTVDIPSGGSTGKISVETAMGSFTSTGDFTFIALTITGRTPDINATDQLLNTSVTITFNANIDTSTVTSSTFYLTQGGTPIASTISFPSSNQIKLTPNSNLSFYNTYIVTVTTGLLDIAGFSLLSNANYGFTTTTQFSLTSVTPANGSTWVDRSQVITINFDKTINPATVNSSTFSITQAGNPVDGTYNASGASATFTPGSQYGFNTVYIINITSGIQDMFGYGVSNPTISSFTSFAGYRIFVTSNSYQGNHGGGANLCNNDPAKPSGNNYLPMLSQWTGLKGDTPYVRPDGTLLMTTNGSISPPATLNNSISTNSEEVWFGSNLQTNSSCGINSIGCCPSNVSGTVLYSYSCSYVCGTYSCNPHPCGWSTCYDSCPNYCYTTCYKCDFYLNCGSWTKNSDSFIGQKGISNQVDTNWYSSGTQSCDQSKKIFCVEQ